MYVKRKIEYEILHYLPRPEIIALVGPRQCGKTTVLKHIYATLTNAVFLTFEDQQILALFEHDIKQFIETYVKGHQYLFIDEFQYAHTGGKLLKYIYDVHPIKIIISGSSMIDLTIKTLKFLVGRIIILGIYPFDFYEFLLARDHHYATLYQRLMINLSSATQPLSLATEQAITFRNYYEEYTIWGGYPQIVLTAERSEKQLLLRNIYNTYFLRDVKSLLGLVDDYKFGKLINALALQIGGLINYRELTQLAELSYTTIKKQLNFLSKTYISECIKPWYTNKRIELVKNPKVFFYDTGLRNTVINDFRLLVNRPDTGQLLENAVWMQLTKRQYVPQYWRDKNQNEIDFIVDLGEQRVAALEIKQQQRKCRSFPPIFVKQHPATLLYCCYLETQSFAIQPGQLFIPLI